MIRLSIQARQALAKLTLPVLIAASFGLMLLGKADTLLAEGRETRIINGRNCLLEFPLRGDVALVDAWEADRWGNLTHRESARNFNPVMAMAAELTIVQTRHVVALGDIPPANVHTPGVFVHRVVHVPVETVPA